MVVEQDDAAAAAVAADHGSPSGQAEATGNTWPERGQVLSPPGGITYLRVLAPFSATNFVLTLADGTQVGGGTYENLLTLTAPASSNGPLNLTYTDAGATTTRTIATLIAGKVVNPNPPSGRLEQSAPILASKVMLVGPDGKPTRIRIQHNEDGSKTRVSTRNGQAVQAK